MENTKPNKKLYIVVEVILFAVYILKDLRSKKEEVILRKPKGCDGCLVFLR